MLKKIDHLGIAVRSIDQAMEFFEKILGLKCEGIETVESQKVKTAEYCLCIQILELAKTDWKRVLKNI